MSDKINVNSYTNNNIKDNTIEDSNFFNLDDFEDNTQNFGTDSEEEGYTKNIQKNNNISESQNEKININNNKISSSLSFKDSTSTQFTKQSQIYNSEIKEINNYIYPNNNINNSIIISDDEYLINILIINLINTFSNKKICFLVNDMKKLDMLFKTLNDRIVAPRKILSLQGGLGKKIKKDYQKFQDFINNGDIIIAIPDILYKLLSTGFVKIFQFDILFIDECQLCDGNHSYNLIMSEYYYYYYFISKKNKTNKVAQLPNIIGFVNSFSIDTNILNNDKKCLDLLKTISENLNCQIIIKPTVFNEQKNLDDIEYIKIKSHLDNKEDFEKIYKIIKHYFIEKMIKLGINNFTKQYNNLDEKIVKNYIQVNKKKFFAKNFEEYANIESSEKSLHFLSQNSYIFRIFEDIQKLIVILLQNLDLESLINLFEKYIKSYEDYLKKEENDEIRNEINAIKGIITDTKEAFKCVMNKIKFNFNSDRIIKLINILQNIDENKKIVIITLTRKHAYVLNNYLKKNYKTDYISGISNKKEENNLLILPTKVTANEIKERCIKFNDDKINILICTPQVNDLLKINKCDIVIVFNEMLPNDYNKIKIFSDNYKSKLLIISETIEIDNKKFEFENKLYNLFKKTETCKDFRGENYLALKIKEIGNQYLYNINETGAKLSLKNIMSIFNELNISFLNQGFKIIQNKKIDEIIVDKVKKYKCKLELWDGTKVYSHTCRDKQTAENECYLQATIFLHKKRKINNNFKMVINNEK